MLPAVFTAGNILCGYLSLDASTQGAFEYAAKLIFLAAILDGLDGRIARWTSTTSAFGEQLDSLADIVELRRRARLPRLPLGAHGLRPRGARRLLPVRRLRAVAPRALQRSDPRRGQALVRRPPDPVGRVRSLRPHLGRAGLRPHGLAPRRLPRRHGGARVPHGLDVPLPVVQGRGREVAPRPALFPALRRRPRVDLLAAPVRARGPARDVRRLGAPRPLLGFLRPKPASA